MPDDLSTLHRDILKVACGNHDKRLRDADDASPADLFDHEVLHLVFEFPYRKEGWFKKLPDPRTEPNGEFFSMKDIGEDRHLTMMKTARRAFAELEERGLCKCIQGSEPEWLGIDLTPEGVQVAKGQADAYVDPFPDL